MGSDRIQELDAETWAEAKRIRDAQMQILISDAKAMKQKPASLSIKFFRGAKSRIWWKIEDASKALSRSSTSYSTEEKARVVWEKVRKWVVEESVDLVRETDAFRDAVQAADAATSELKAQIKELKAEAEGLVKTIAAKRDEIDAADAATSELKSQVHGLEQAVEQSNSILRSREGMTDLLTEQRDEARADARQWQMRHRQAFSSRVRRLFRVG